MNTENNRDEIMHINNEEREVYADPFLVSDEGENFIWYYSVDVAGNEEDIQSEHVKIDYTPPTVFLTKQKISKDEIKFTTYVTDDVSGANRVEFYLDNELQLVDTEEPYTWTGTGSYTVKAVGYDTAGRSAVDIKRISYAQSLFFDFVHRCPPRLFSLLNALYE